MLHYKISKENRGAISVYLCIMFGIMVSVILVMIEGARVNAMKLNIECATDMGTDSLLSEYHKELLSRYGLLFIDTSYEYNEGSLQNVADHLENYLSYNLKVDKDLNFTGKIRDFYGLDIESIDILNVSRATDDDGAVFRQMAISYMMDKYGLSIIENAKDLIETTNSYSLDEGNILEDNSNYQNQIDNIEYPEMEGVDWDEVDTSNPSENSKAASGKGILSLVCSDTISSKATNKNTLASRRDKVSGIGLIEKWPDYSSVPYDILYNEYVLDKFGCYTKLKNDSALDYQIEYILFGKDNDTANLRTAAERILLIRGASNLIYFMSDSELKAEVKAMAMALAVVTLLPSLYDLYYLALSTALIFAESLYDVSVLLNDGKVPLIKSKGDWTFSLENALSALAGSFAGSSTKNDKGQDYKDYLRILLYLTGNDGKVMRTMDVVEMDIRKITGKNNFRLDDCIAAGDVQIIFQSTYGYSLLMKRSFFYW